MFDILFPTSLKTAIVTKPVALGVLLSISLILLS